jgi:hypothetical protein
VTVTTATATATAATVTVTTPSATPTVRPARTGPATPVGPLATLCGPEAVHRCPACGPICVPPATFVD